MAPLSGAVAYRRRTLILIGANGEPCLSVFREQKSSTANQRASGYLVRYSDNNTLKVIIDLGSFDAGP